MEKAVLYSGPGPAQVHTWCTVQLRLQESSTSGRGAGEPSRPELGAECRVWGRAGDSLLGAGREESGKEGTFRQWMGNLSACPRDRGGRDSLGDEAGWSTPSRVFRKGSGDGSWKDEAGDVMGK